MCIRDSDTAAKVYGNTEDTAVYQDATFFVKGDKNLDSVIKDLGKLDINWREYNLIKSSSNYPALQQSISGIYSISNKLFVGSLIFAGVVVSLLLFLWMNARKKEIADVYKRQKGDYTIIENNENIILVRSRDAK